MANNELKPIAWVHTLHMEGGQVSIVPTLGNENPFGEPGEDYSESFTVTSTPAYAAAPAQAEPSDALPEAWRVRVALDGEPCRLTLQEIEPVAADMEALRAFGYQVEVTELVAKQAIEARGGALTTAVPEGFQRLETVKFWADAFADDAQRVAGAMISKLLNEYVQLREALILGQQGGVSDAARLDANELWKALNDLSFDCFGGIGTCAPSLTVYNRTFAVMDRHRAKYAAIQAQAGDEEKT